MGFFSLQHSAFSLVMIRSSYGPQRSNTMPAFPGVDYMNIDSLFSEEELMVRQTVRDFVDEEVLPIIEHANREEKFPSHLVPKMAEMGLFGATISDYGLPGLNNVAYGQIGRATCRERV